MNKKTIAVSASMALAVFHSYAQSIQFDQIYSIGDSLSDVGTYSAAVIAGSGGSLPNDIRYRFTNNNEDGTSQVWVESLASKLGLSLQPNFINPTLVGGTAFAEGGARVSDPNGIGNNPSAGITTTPVTTQVDRLLALKPQLTNRDLIYVWAGANDGFSQFELISSAAITSTQGLINMATEAGTLSNQVRRLSTAGAEFVVVALMPDLAQTPFGARVALVNPAGAVALTALSNSFNAQAKATVPAAGGIVMDVNKLLADIIANPVRYGFNADALGTTACGVNPAATGPDDFFISSLSCVNANTSNFLFADGVHPSAQAHAVLGRFAFSGLQAISQASTLVVAPMVSIRQHALSLENRLNNRALLNGGGQMRPAGDMYVYVNPEVGQFDFPSSQIDPSLKASTRKVSLGLDMMITNSALLGWALSHSNGQAANFGNNSGQLKTTNTVGTMYSTLALSKNWFMNASAAYGMVHHNTFERQLVLDTTTVQAQSSPKGNYTGFRVGLGWIGDFAGGKGGPQISLSSEKVQIRSFTEEVSPISMGFGDLSYRTSRLSVSGQWMQEKPKGQWRWFGRASVERDLASNGIQLAVGPDANSLSSVTVQKPAQTFWSSTLGLSRQQHDNSLWSVQLGMGGPQSKLQSYTLGATYLQSF